MRLRSRKTILRYDNSFIHSFFAHFSCPRCLHDALGSLTELSLSLLLLPHTHPLSPLLFTPKLGFWTMSMKMKRRWHHSFRCVFKAAVHAAVGVVEVGRGVGAMRRGDPVASKYLVSSFLVTHVHPRMMPASSSSSSRHRLVHLVLLFIPSSSL